MTTKRVKIIVDARDAKKVVKALDADIEDLDVSVNKTNKAFGGLKKVVAAVGGVLAARQVIKYSDAYKSLQNQLRQTTESQEELLEITEKVLGLSNRSRSSLETTARTYTQLSLATTELGLSEAELLRITETINKSFAISGATAEEASGAIRQLIQGFAAGALRGDEFNSVAEQAPEIMRAIAEATGTTIGELRELAADGAITAEVLIGSLGRAADDIDKKFSDATVTFDQSIQIASNNLTSFIGKVEEGSGGVDGLGSSIVQVSEILNDPATIAAAQAFSKAIVEGFGLVVEAGRETVNFVRFVSEEIAAFVGGAAIGDIVRLEDELSGLQDELAQLKESEGFLTGALGIGEENYAKEVEKINARISITEEKLRISREAAEKAAKARNDEAMALERLSSVEPSSTVSAPTINIRPQGNNRDAQREQDRIARMQQTSLAAVRQERALTEELALELQTRRKIEIAYNNDRLSGMQGFFEQERALVDARRAEELALAQQDIANERAEFQEKLAQVQSDEMLTAEARNTVTAEIQAQQELTEQLHQDRITEIDREAAEARKQIAQDELQAKLMMTQQVLGGISSLMDTESRKAFKIGKAAALANAAISGTQSAIDAWEAGMSTGGPWAPAVAAAYTAASLARTGALISQIKSRQFGGGAGQGSAGGGGAPTPSVGTANQPQAVQQPQQQNTVEIRGLNRLAEELANRDPDEAIPVEFAQRIMIGLDEFNRLSGGGNG